MSSRTSKLIVLLLLVTVLVLGPVACASENYTSTTTSYVPTRTYSGYSQATPTYNPGCIYPEYIGSIRYQPPDYVPDALKVPNGHKFKFLLYASGYQNYQCKGGAHGQPGNWTFVGPVANLINDIYHGSFGNACNQVVFHHLEKTKRVSGVAWSGIIPSDYSMVVANAVMTYPSPDGENNIPWLLAKAIYNSGDGVFSDVTFVYRTETYGGKAPPNEKCGTEFSDGYKYASPYEAQYWYYHKIEGIY
ncbi:600_t:CDS:2 [Paraglomus brasilianum]|uniref:600_t:CDS:1 n=1 Tax=Paraglomus brasilianum TaxID=144538 RepID=A0A9N8WJB1_9GLOM|nr:600_t:CDS:2 [Paraglomus brasilianum]